MEAGPSSAFPWKKVWQLQVPNKVRHFLYRAAANRLPCKRNLARRGVLLHDSCVLCNADGASKTLDRLFLQCEWTQRFWFAVLNLRSSTLSSFRGWILGLLLNGDAELLTRVVMLVWALWKHRNEILFHGGLADVGVVTNMAYEVLRDWTEANERRPAREGRQNQETMNFEKGWIKPREGALRINIDAGWFGENGQGLGLVIRDHHGECMYAATKFLSSRSNPAVEGATCMVACWHWTLYSL
ncbi:uncharacterized protein LOC130725663 [Lotus japonicus]|uniref:uncharacterized protein LOC130725663 n=1 Tax=Lotus japonicus TaxID=34305 RepID=UPI0025861379|nr:uncharacterized protein LOC130725663 [Lotus japonicus]